MVESKRRDRTDQIARALRDEVIIPVFQPCFELATGKVVGYEALARFHSEPLQGPEAWFKTASEVGMLLELELAAAHAALDQLAALRDDLRIGVNVSPSTALSPQFRALLDATPPGRVVIELTEHVPIDNYRAVAAAIDELRERDVRLAIDDCGAGFASLRHILRLSPEVIKLDITLTRDIHTDRGQRAVTSALISLGGEIDATIVAEGIETKEELAALQGLGVRYGQGYYLGRPAPLPGPRQAA